MFPQFDDRGCLPAGVYPATVDEIAARFGTESEIRQVEMESVRWLVDLAWRAGVQRIVIDGSFITDKFEPNDIDCALLIGPNYPSDPAADAELQDGLPFIQALFLTKEAFDFYLAIIFGKDEDLVPKGLVEVIQ